MQGILPGRPLGFARGQIINALLAISMVGRAIWGIAAIRTRLLAGGGDALVLGVLAVIPIGGADMPVSSRC